MTLLFATKIGEAQPLTVIFHTADNYPYVDERQPGQPFHLVRLAERATEAQGALDLGAFMLARAVETYAPGATTRVPAILSDGLEPNTQVEARERDGLRYARFEQGRLVVYATLVMPRGTR